MTNKCSLLTAILFIAFNINLNAQSRFSNCSAAFLDGKIIVDDYSPTGKCILNSSASGKLTVYTATYENNQWKTGDRVSFKLTLRDGATKTLMSYSDVTYQEIDIKKVLSKCRKGDSIVVSIVKDEYALPHNEILVE